MSYDEASHVESTVLPLVVLCNKHKEDRACKLTWFQNKCLLCSKLISFVNQVKLDRKWTQFGFILSVLFLIWKPIHLICCIVWSIMICAKNKTDGYRRETFKPTFILCNGIYERPHQRFLHEVLLGGSYKRYIVKTRFWILNLNPCFCIYFPCFSFLINNT